MYIPSDMDGQIVVYAIQMVHTLPHTHFRLLTAAISRPRPRFNAPV
jgi:hypothetical protein